MTTPTAPAPRRPHDGQCPRCLQRRPLFPFTERRPQGGELHTSHLCPRCWSAAAQAEEQVAQFDLVTFLTGAACSHPPAGMTPLFEITA